MPHPKMWDVGGSALRGRMLDKYVYGADAVVLVYDVSNFNSFENLQEWLSACKAAMLQVGACHEVAVVCRVIHQLPDTFLLN